MFTFAMTAALMAPVDIYCERTSPAFWAEPVNALTNLSFIAAALWGLSEARRRGEGSRAVFALIGLVALIGIGSFLFHSFAQVWSSLADVIPIWIFVALAAAISAVRIGGARPATVAITALALLAAIILAQSFVGDAQSPRPAPRFNGSLQYAPAVVVLLVFTIIAALRRSPLTGWIGAALLVFTLSLLARTFDMAVCGKFPLGLHWIWHLLNGLVIGIILQITIRAGRYPAPRKS